VTTYETAGIRWTVLARFERPRECADDHAHQLIDALQAVGHAARVQLDEGSFTALERVD
jgi:hypothetical protein